MALISGALLWAGCPARRGGQTNSTSGPEANVADAGAEDAADGDAAPADAEPELDASPAEADASPDAPASDPPDRTSGPVLGRHRLEDAGGELRVERADEGYVIRLAAPGDAGVSVEPIGRIEGAESGSIFMGPGCRSAAASSSEVLATWRGRWERCATTLVPMAVTAERDPRPACPVEAAAPGTYRLQLFACGSTLEPLFTVAFDLEASSTE